MLLEQEEQPEELEPAKGLSTPLIPKVENFFVTSSLSHLGHFTTVELITSISKSLPHAPHLYSKIGINKYNREIDGLSICPLGSVPLQ